MHHFPDQIIKAVQENNGWGSRITISDESGEVLETGGGLKKAKPYFDTDECFMTLNVDILTDLDLKRFMKFHKEKKPLISFAISDRKTSRYFLFDEENQLTGWKNTTTGELRMARKATEKEIAGMKQMAYSCVVIFEPEIFSMIKQEGKFSLVDVYLDLARENRILGYDHSGDKFVDVGKPAAVEIAESLFK